MTKDEALDYIYRQQDIFTKHNLDRDITDVVIPLLNDVAKIISKIDKNMEQQIAERAREYALSMYPDMRDEELQSYSDCRRDYAHGAREQRKIAIDKAYEWLKNNIPIEMWEYDLSDLFEDFKNAMEG